MPIPLLFPMTAHVALAAVLYALLPAVRAPSLWGLERLPDGTNWMQLNSCSSEV